MSIKSKSRWLVLLGVVMMALGAYFEFGGLTHFAGDPAEIDCYHRTDIPPGAIIDESPDHFPEGEVVPLPLGYRCSYFAGDGQPRIVTYEGWITSVLVYGSLVLLVGGAFTIVRGRRLRSHDEDEQL